MADNHAIPCLVAFMDELWFHQVLFFPLNILHPPSMEPEDQPLPLLSNSSSAHTSDTQVISEEDSSILSNQDDQSQSHSNEQDNDDEEEIPKRLQLSDSRACHHSSSPSSRKRRSSVYPAMRRRLSKTMSCKSLCELELEEVKGFMDLGFTFDKGQLNKRMMSVLPGLQRLDLGYPRNNEQEADDGGDDEAAERGRVTRPYLSEAWLVKRPDSPLLNLRVPRVSTDDDMKKHLKYWAKTVATAIQLESCW